MSTMVERPSRVSGRKKNMEYCCVLPLASVGGVALDSVATCPRRRFSWPPRAGRAAAPASSSPGRTCRGRGRHGRAPAGSDAQPARRPAPERPRPPCLSSGPGLAQESSRCHAGGASSAAVLATAASSGDREVPAMAEPSASARAPSPRTNGQARCRAVPNRAARGPPRTTLLGRRRHAQPSDAAPAIEGHGRTSHRVESRGGR